MTSQMLLLLLLQVCTSPVTSFTCDVTRAPTDQRGDRRTNDQEEAETTRAMRFGVLYRRGAYSGSERLTGYEAVGVIQCSSGGRTAGALTSLLA